MNLSAQEVLVSNQDQLVQLLNDCRTNSGFDVSRIAGVDVLSKEEREVFAEKLSAASAKAGSFDTSELSRRLDLLAGRHENGDMPLCMQNRHLRSPTSSPAPEDNDGFEAFCYDELVKAGGRPVIPIELLSDAMKHAEVDKNNLELWLSDKHSSGQDGDLPPVFSKQSEDWMSFQQKWQWDNRGRIASEEGFSAFLESQKKRWLHKGELGVVHDPYFEDTTRNMWNNESRFFEQSGEDGFSAYTRAVERRLSSHGCMETYELTEDPREQDARTTWIEYLSYTYFWQDRYAAKMKAAEPRYHKAWDKLQNFDTAPLTDASVSTEILDEELIMIRTKLQTTRQHIRDFIQGTKTYRMAEKAFHRQRRRAEWILEQLPLIKNVAPLPEHEAAEGGKNVRSSKKRKTRNGHDAPSPQQFKRLKQENKLENSVSDLQSKAGSGVGPRRSQRLRIDDVTPKAGFPMSHARVQRVRKISQLKEIVD